MSSRKRAKVSHPKPRRKAHGAQRGRKERKAPPRVKLWLNTREHCRDTLTDLIREFYGRPKRTTAQVRDFKAVLYSFTVLLNYWGADLRAEELDVTKRLESLEEYAKQHGGLR
jgi:hypothetical protein